MHKLIKITLSLLLLFSLNVSFSQEDYKSPYSIQFSYPKDSLINDILNTERGDFHNSSTFIYKDWDSKQVSEKFGIWGPPSKQFSFPELAENKSPEWMRERIIAVAELFLGYEYQHHHIPVWDPPSNWKWKQTCAGKNGKGTDCSNFTSFVYNIALGIKLNGNTVKQSHETDLSENHNPDFKTSEVINAPEFYEDFIKIFKPGDLLFIKNVYGEISHVIIWLGDTGISYDNTPLIMDSHGDEVKDINGDMIPCGIQIRPFRKNSWYYKSFSHAIRIVKS